MKEEDGDVAGAAEVLQEVHVETYGALNKMEKADFILEQVSSFCPPLSLLFELQAFCRMSCIVRPRVRS